MYATEVQHWQETLKHDRVSLKASQIIYSTKIASNFLIVTQAKWNIIDVNGTNIYDGFIFKYIQQGVSQGVPEIIILSAPPPTQKKMVIINWVKPPLLHAESASSIYFYQWNCMSKFLFLSLMGGRRTLVSPKCYFLSDMTLNPGFWLWYDWTTAIRRSGPHCIRLCPLK